MGDDQNNTRRTCLDERLLHSDLRHGLTMLLSNDGVWTGCRQRQCTPSRQQVARDETAESLIPLSFPTLSLSIQLADRQGQRCMQLLSDILTLDWEDGLDWALLRLLPLKG